ncbi:aminotransferase class IV [Streptomyces sp. AM 2-1-1]|uniref:aminotransferase class IV n=1 Tax=unclassified Streptomyces TaxID=2593676 RepID=UPI0023B96E30|nr:aminotransferase class IV [Streptomyces sp. AM 2-1-1]WEH41929.1 aminotransferase class IV [Streptomyces sp. AM 2-1-1]
MIPFSPAPYVEFDGRPATPDDLRIPAFAGYGHFTAFQVEDGRVRGRDLHLNRLRAANQELFGLDLEAGQVRELVRGALAGAGVRDASVRVHGYLPPGAATTVLMVTVAPPVAPAREALSLRSVPYARELPHLKRPGDFGQAYYGRLAVRSGYDQALLTAPGGVVTEGSTTNVGFWDGSSVVWPDAPALVGITMALLEEGLALSGSPSARRPVTLDRLGAFRAAFVTNSQRITPVRRVDDRTFPVDAELMELLETVYGAAPADVI